MNSTWTPKAGDVEAGWFVIDASGYNLGRLATRIATVLRGKHKPQFAPHVDVGDFVIVLNASQVNLTGTKLDRKRYYRYSGYPGGLKAVVARTVRANDPERMLRQAVKGMLPKNRLASRIITKLKVYDGAEHPHVAQQPSPLPEVF